MKEEFIKFYQHYITREGSKELLEYLEKSDFFTAPASTRFHGAFEGGLCTHSVNVFKQLVRLCNTYRKELGLGKWDEKAESIAICALLHDLCKIGCYKMEMRNKKDESGQWIQVPFYTFEEDRPMGGHGYKSVFLIEDYMKLTEEERVAIACHMGAYDRAAGDYSLTNAFEKYPFAFLLHTADSAATFMDEVRKG